MLAQRIAIIFTFICLFCLAHSSAFARPTAGGKIYKDEAAPGPMVLMLLTAERVPKYLEYSNSQLMPVVRIKIAYREIDKNRDNTEVKYEDLWYAGGRPVGLERYHSLDLHGSQIILRVNQQELDEREINPVANSIVRVFLDAALNDNSVYSCIVPNEPFDTILSAFQNQRFYAPGTSDVLLDPSITLVVHTQTSGQNRLLQFAR
ncbi:MAG: hypothetical protein C5B53_02215 [Candidatus Melainabacteria bacterium]|nr:MAG: hypothetical protein C5B53_02215 [Candidatus Melainabacteria bacterium]